MSDISDLGWSNFNIDLAELASPHYWTVMFLSPQLLHNLCNCKKTEKLPEQIPSHAIKVLTISLKGSYGGDHRR